MAYTTLQLTQDEAVLTITVNRPEVLNAQSRLMLEEFDQAMDDAAENQSVKVVIVAPHSGCVAARVSPRVRVSPERKNP